MAYVQNTGFNKWADTNNIVVVYPQAINISGNPNGCWDWWGYLTGTANTYDTKTGPQMAALQKLIDWAGGKYSPIQPPTNLQASNVGDTSLSLSWTASSGASGYNIYRNNAKVNANTVTGTSYSDTSLSSGTTYSYYVTALASTGGESGSSNNIQVTTTGTPSLQPPTGLRVTTPNSNNISFTWNGVADATGYNFYRNGAKVGSSTTTSYIDTGLQPSTNYQNYVTATKGTAESPASNTITSSTTSAWNCQQWTASNYDQVAAGRAYQQLGYVYAKGSDQYMGLYNTFETKTLAEISKDYYIIGNCPKEVNEL